jgi:RNA polymerase sigma-70 factor (ECF subfamily)
MRQIGMLLLAAILMAGVGIAENQTGITVKSMPPSVVKTVPQAGDTAVDPSLKEISVTFSKDMMTEEMWSWCSQSPQTFPEIDKTKIRYLKDKRTCVLPVKLRTGKTYVIWINSQKFNHFKDTENNSAVPYLLVFQTASKAPSSSSRSVEGTAISAAEAWLSLVDNGQYVESWNEAAQYFKGAVSKDQWGKAIRAARKPLGKNLSREFMSKSYHTSLPGAPDGEYVVIQFNRGGRSCRTCATPQKNGLS